MNNVPAVYVPTQPEGDGITLPTLLSVLAHGIVLGLLIYTYQSPEIETSGSIETTMVSPEQLAEMQGQILANRAAAQAASSSESTANSENTTAVTQMSVNNSNVNSRNERNTNQSSAQPRSQTNSQQVPVFTRSDDLADTDADEPILMSQEHRQRLLEQNQEYERNIAEMAARLDEATLAELQRVEDIKQKQLEAEREQLRALRYKENNPPKIERPTSSDRNIKIDTGSQGTNKNMSLSEGQPVATGNSSANTNATSSEGRAGGSSRSRSASDSEVRGLIKENFSSPTAEKGKAVTTMLTITVDSNGVITDVATSGNDPRFDAAVADAAWQTRKLPIYPGDRKYPTFQIQYNGSTK